MLDNEAIILAAERFAEENDVPRVARDYSVILHTRTTGDEAMIGRRFTRWVVVSRVENRDGGRAYECQCDCGQKGVVTGRALRREKSRSCGCLAIEESTAKNTKHGHASTGNHSRTYDAWIEMRRRCRPKNADRNKHHAGRGITVAPEWEDYEQFLSDMGECPEGYTLERKNNDLGYSKENCKWATMAEQNRNRRNNRRLTFDGRTMVIADWVKETGLTFDTISWRIRNNWPVERALTEPSHYQRGK